MSIGVLTLHILLPGCSSLKEKRSRLKPLLARLHREFNVSAAEVGLLDSWGEAVLACALVSNDSSFTQGALQSVADWVENYWRDVDLVENHVEMI